MLLRQRLKSCTLFDVWNAEMFCDLLPSQQQMAFLDEKTIASGVSATELMERAGQGVFNVIAEKFADKRKVCLLVGSGNNGGDGLVVARLMLQGGLVPEVLIAPSTNYSPDMRLQLDRYLKCGGRAFIYADRNVASVLHLESLERAAAKEILNSSEVIIDALLGTGQRSAPRGGVGSILADLFPCTTTAPIISIDLPSGINGDSGEVYEDALKADLTLCIQLLKRGMLQYPAREYCGEVVVVPIGIAADESEVEYRLLTTNNLSHLPKRVAWGHKKNYGHIFVVAGSRNMSGAGVLAATAALRSGAGLVTKAQLISVTTADPPEIMFYYLDDQKGGIFTSEMAKEIIEQTQRSDVLLIGPGLGEVDSTKSCVLEVLSKVHSPVVIDASALNSLATAGDLVLPQEAVLTPHTGEAARLLGVSVEDVQRDRYAAASEISEKYKAVTVLKGAGTVIYFAGRGFVSDIANPYLATAGSGDVLAGVIAAFMGQGVSAFEAAKLAVMVHGVAGERAHLKTRGFITASDIIAALSFENIGSESDC
ncbi:MAG: NAD(P)H-hydrate dehydratase [Bdellovibrionota bacterium]|jgi:hydroxyethylthiazole kinase-like uncharacterized protein yjeF